MLGPDQVRAAVDSVAPDGVVVFEEFDSASAATADAVADCLGDASRVYVICTRTPVPDRIRELCTGGEVVMAGTGSKPV